MKFDSFVIRQADKVLEFITDWFSLNRVDLLIILSWIQAAVNMSYDRLVHNGLFWYAVDLIFLSVYLVLSKSITSKDGRAEPYWISIRYMCYILSVAYLTFAICSPSVKHWIAFAIIAVYLLWVIVLGCGYEGPKGKKRKALLQKWNEWGSWLQVPVSQSA
jgi:hypothetical protein